MRDHIIETAAALFYKEGVRAVGVDRIVAEAGIAKATLYRHSPNKEKLIVAYLESRHEQVLMEMTSALATITEDPRARGCDLRPA